MMEDLHEVQDHVQDFEMEDFTALKDYGRERGSNPILTDAQTKEFDKFANKTKMTLKTMKKTNTEIESDDFHSPVDFDLTAKKRVILFQGKVNKRSYSAMLQHTSSRYMVLLT
jgi:hypothetical protein